MISSILNTIKNKSIFSLGCSLFLFLTLIITTQSVSADQPTIKVSSGLESTAEIEKNSSLVFINKCKIKHIIVNNLFDGFYINCCSKKGLDNMLVNNNNVAMQSVTNFKCRNSNTQAPVKSFQQNPTINNLAKMPISTLQAYNNIAFRGGPMHVEVDFIPPKGMSVNFSSMTEAYKNSSNKLNSLVANNNPNYTWVNLPEKLIKENYVENVYDKVADFKKPFGEDSKLIFIALGNPANADEMAKSLGYGHNMVYACDVNPAQIRDTIRNAGGNLDKIQIIISSKSGSTFESNQTFKLLIEELTEHYEKKGVKPEEMKNQISKHILCLTDKNPEKSTLKREAIARGFETIDCVEGPSGFADLAYSMPTLAYVGLPKASATKMLKAADDMSKTLMKSKDLNHNLAAEIAAYDCNGATKERFIFHDAHFANFANTETQLYSESLRKLSFAADVYPRGAHAGLEPAISRELSGQQLNNITNVLTKVNYKPDAREASYLVEAEKLERAHIQNAQNEGHFQKNIILEIGHDGISPESLGEFETLKSFVGYYKNEFENEGNMNIFNIKYVDAYKAIRTSL